jgi:hypothetical protein
MNLRLIKGPAAFCVLHALVACGQQPAASTTQDIYTNDSSTRTVATAEQLMWTVKKSNCSGSALNAQYILTAAHCETRVNEYFTSGAALAAGGRNDLQVVRLAEVNRNLDYAIAEVKWVKGAPHPDQRYSPKILMSRDALTLGKDGEATQLFTVGFPVDKAKGMHALGYAKKWGAQVLYYNVGSINGNSGGAVWTTGTKTLVSLTNAGPHMYGEGGWNYNNPENPAAWNWGASMTEVYKASKIMQQVFPNGDNATVDDDGHLEN